MRMKKTAVFFLSFIMALSLSGCGKETMDIIVESGDASSDAQEESDTIEVLTPSVSGQIDEGDIVIYKEGGITITACNYKYADGITNIDYQITNGSENDIWVYMQNMTVDGNKVEYYSENDALIAQSVIAGSEQTFTSVIDSGNFTYVDMEEPSVIRFQLSITSYDENYNGEDVLSYTNTPYMVELLIGDGEYDSESDDSGYVLYSGNDIRILYKETYTRESSYGEYGIILYVENKTDQDISFAPSLFDDEGERIIIGQTETDIPANTSAAVYIWLNREEEIDMEGSLNMSFWIYNRWTVETVVQTDVINFEI